MAVLWSRGMLSCVGWSTVSVSHVPGGNWGVLERLGGCGAKGRRRRGLHIRVSCCVRDCYRLREWPGVSGTDISYIKRALPRHILGTIKNDKMKGGLACYCRRVRIVMRMIPSRVCLCSTRLIARRNILEYSVFSSRSMENDRAVSSIRVPLRQIFLLASGGSVVHVVYFVHPAVIKVNEQTQMHKRNQRTFTNTGAMMVRTWPRLVVCPREKHWSANWIVFLSCVFDQPIKMVLCLVRKTALFYYNRIYYFYFGLVISFPTLWLCNK